MTQTECAHKQSVSAYGTWVAGVELIDQKLPEWRHRYNHEASLRLPQRWSL